MENLFTNSWIVGIGITVIGGLILYYVFGIGKNQKLGNKTQHNQVISGNGNIMAGRDLIIDSKVSTEKKFSKITPLEIKKNLDDLPPYQRKAIAGNYMGLSIKWKVSLESIHTLSNGNIKVNSSSDGKLYPWISFEINPEVYPEFKLMKKGKKFTIEGLIEKVDSDIDLKECVVNEN